MRRFRRNLRAFAASQATILHPSKSGGNALTAHKPDAREHQEKDRGILVMKPDRIYCSDYNYKKLSSTLKLLPHSDEKGDEDLFGGRR